MIRISLLFFVLLAAPLSVADTLYSTLPLQGSSLDERACQLRIANGPSQPVFDDWACSGTMMNSHIFVTAGHCFLDLPAALYSFYVRCPGGRQAAVRDVWLHENYRDLSESKKADGKFDPPFFVRIREEFDLAIATTNEISSISPVTLASDEEYDRLVSRDECHFQGYSPKKCDPNKLNCERRVAIQKITRYFVNLETNARFVGNGDSGSGLFCRDEKGVDKYVGEAVTETDNQGFVRLRNFRDLLQQIEKGQYPAIDVYVPEYLKAIESYNAIAKILAKSNLKVSLTIGHSLGVAFSKYLPVMTALEKYFSAHPEIMQKLTDKKIVAFQFYYAPAMYEQLFAGGKTKIEDIKPVDIECGPTRCWFRLLHNATYEQVEKFFDNL